MLTKLRSVGFGIVVLLGICALLGLVLLGPDQFLAPSLALTAAALLALDAARGKAVSA